MGDQLRARARLVFAAGGSLMAVSLVVGTLLLVNGGPDDAVAVTQRTVLEPSPTEEPEPTTTAVPVTAAKSERRRCWDTRVVQGEKKCPVDNVAAQFFAFGLDLATCRVGRSSGHARWSYECPVRGVDVHLATYNADDRDERLSSYGATRDLGGGRILAGGPRTAAGRWLRTYDAGWAAKGMLMYASVDARDPRDYQVLIGLQQAYPDAMLRGEPILSD